MIVEWVMNGVMTVVEWIFNMVPDIPIPDWFTNVGDVVGQVLAVGYSMGVWVPWGLAAVVMQVLFTAILGGAVIKLFRIVASFLTMGGGSAA